LLRALFLVGLCLLWSTRCHSVLHAAALMSCLLLQQLPYQPAMMSAANMLKISILFVSAMDLLLWEHTADKIQLPSLLTPQPETIRPAGPLGPCESLSTHGRWRTFVHCAKGTLYGSLP
jgi:hypothetical protein